ncbi:MAG TPA: hypothetical protein P5205_10120 [Candidatus Paceibacterota bacterium]|nr:hypothetical protein [Verrucomicrobiota bacterium]HSA10711.1 hypothetical protein [Candidatus Paceibacterota bacterium]
MGLLSLFTKPAPSVLRLPSGSFTVDRLGCVLTSTLPSSFPASALKDIARKVQAAFGEAAAAQLPLAELVITYPSLKIAARELRGGLIVYLTPKTPSSPQS